MPKPLQQVDTRFDELLQDLPSDMVELAYKCKAFVRARKIKSPAELLRLVLSYGGLDQSLREAGAVMALRGQPLCDQSVKERLESCLPWIEALLKELMPAPEVPSLAGPQRWLVCDGSTVQAPGATTTDYRVHVCLDVVRVAVVEVKVTDQKTGESLAHFRLGAGDTVLTDRGYATAHEIVTTRQRQAHLVMRMSAHNLPLFDASAERIDLQAVLRADPLATLQTVSVVIKDPESQQSVTAWVHAARLDQRAAEAERRRLHRRAQKNGQTVKASTLFFADWLLVVTTWPPEQLSAETILALYRVRWQVELVIKRWKSLLDLDRLRARRGSALATVWLTGKLLYAWLIERRARRRLGDHWTRLDQHRTATWWRVWKLIAAEVAVAILGVEHWRRDDWSECLAVLAERPRRRKLQTLPRAVISLLHPDQSLALSLAA